MEGRKGGRREASVEVLGRLEAVKRGTLYATKPLEGAPFAKREKLR